jgi:hypothetical protein
MYRSVHTCVHVHSQLYKYVFTYLRARARERESERERGRARAVWLVLEHAVMIHRNYGQLRSGLGSEVSLRVRVSRVSLRVRL